MSGSGVYAECVTLMMQITSCICTVYTQADVYSRATCLY